MTTNNTEPLHHIVNLFVCVADVMILADVFQTFRNSSLRKGSFEIDPGHYVSAPQMAWDAMLKM